MRKIFGIIGTTIAIAAMSFGIFIGTIIVVQRGQEEAYVKAMEEFRNAINSEKPDVDRINELTEETNSDGYFLYVEIAAKTYLHDVFVPFMTVQKMRKEDGLFKDGLTKDLIEKDQPEFEESLETISEMREQTKLVQAAADKLFDRDFALRYIESEELDERYVDMYIEQVQEIYEDQEMKDDLAVFATYMNMQCNAYEEVINFLKNNNGSWHLENDTVVFKTTSLTNQYNQLLAKIDRN
jgi:hypothetical protein